MNPKKPNSNNKTTNVCFISTYPPRECGIATYTQKLMEAIKAQSGNIKLRVMAIKFNDSENYEKNVEFIIERNKKADYKKAAEYINNSDIDVVNIQHEFGIFGGFNGRNVLYLTERIKKPLILTMHSIPILHKNNKTYSSSKYKSKVLLLIKILKNVDGVIIMSKSIKEIIRKDLQFTGKIMVMYHGAQFFKKEEINRLKQYKESLGIKKNEFIISTFGLISPRKGLQFVIKALPELVKNNPNIKIKYFIIGRMHPTESTRYLLNLKRLAKHLHINGNVIFNSNYLPYSKIYQYLANTDIFITPYYKGLANLTSSGTLSYALALGCCIVSTPYVYAKEILSEYKVGELINFADYKSIDKTINYLLKNPKIIQEYKRNSYKLSVNFSWENVSKKYIDIIMRILNK